MKTKIALCLCGFLAISTLFRPVQAEAQTKTDTTIVAVTPIFSGNETTLADTLLAYGKAATDPEFKAVVTDAVAVIKDTPKGGGFEAWVTYLFAVIAAVMAVWAYVEKKRKAKAVAPTNDGRPLPTDY